MSSVVRIIAGKCVSSAIALGYFSQEFFFDFFPDKGQGTLHRDAEGYGGFEFLSFLSFLRGFSLGVGFG